MYALNIHRKRLAVSELVEMPAVRKGELSVRVMVLLAATRTKSRWKFLNGKEWIGLY
jgi:hypothetical protein